MARNFTLPTPKQRRRKVNFLGKPMNRCTRQKLEKHLDFQDIYS